MAENEGEDGGTKVKHLPSQPTYVEVVCKSSGKVKRFAAGTEAGFAVNLINKKLHHHDSDDDAAVPLASHIEAIKQTKDDEDAGEEPISFGPTAVLVNYGPDWKLQTVAQSQGLRQGGVIRKTSKNGHSAEGGIGGSCSVETASKPVLSTLYIGKVLLAFVMIFVIGAIFTLALENLPTLILYMNSM